MRLRNMHKNNYKCLHVGIEGLGNKKSCSAVSLLILSSSMNSGNRKIILCLSLIVSMTSLEMEDRKERKHGL